MLEISSSLANASVKGIGQVKIINRLPFGEYNNIVIFGELSLSFMIPDNLPILHNIVGIFHSAKNSINPKEVIGNRPGLESSSHMKWKAGPNVITR